jgi:hypothetical protein
LHTAQSRRRVVCTRWPGINKSAPCECTRSIHFLTLSLTTCLYVTFLAELFVLGSSVGWWSYKDQYEHEWQEAAVIHFKTLSTSNLLMNCWYFQVLTPAVQHSEIKWALAILKE